MVTKDPLKDKSSEEVAAEIVEAVNAVKGSSDLSRAVKRMLVCKMLMSKLPGLRLIHAHAMCIAFLRE